MSTSKLILEMEREVEEEVVALALTILPSITTIADANQLIEAVNIDLALHEHRVKVGKRIRQQYEFHLNKLRRAAGEIT